MGIRFTVEEYHEYLDRKVKTSVDAVAADCRRYGRRETSSVASGDSFPKGEASGRSKYGNRKVEVDGRKFDSAHEARVWTELNYRVKARELKCVLRQVPFELPGGIRYFADFVTIAPDMSIEGVYDAKSEITKKNRVYINKRKQVLAIYGITIKEV